MSVFSAEQPRLSVPQAARLSGLTPALRGVLTLVHEGFAQTDSREYWLTPKALRLGQAWTRRNCRMLRPIIEQVARHTQEHVSVGTRDGDEIIHLVRSRYAMWRRYRSSQVRGCRCIARPGAGVAGWLGRARRPNTLRVTRCRR